MYMEQRHIDIVQEILRHYPYEFYAFGSRVKGKNRKNSDLDLCYTQDIPFRDLRKLHEEFEDSNLPFTIDIVNYNRCTKNFQDHLKSEMILFSKTSGN